MGPEKNKIKVLFVIHNLLGGGSEKVFVTILRLLDKNRFLPTLLLVQNKISLDITSLSDVPIECLNTRGRFAIFKLYKAIKRHNPDIVFSTLGQINVMVALLSFFRKEGQKFIVRESSIVSQRNKDELLPSVFQLLFQTVYHNLDQIICQGKYMANDLIVKYRINPNKIFIINNPVDFAQIVSLSRNETGFSIDDSKVNIAFVGHLNNIKRPELAIQTIKELNDQKYHLHIIGTGEDETKLKEFVANETLDRQITFWGFLKNPYALLAKCDVLLSVSKYEGFPNAVLEANALGLPVISYKYPGGITEIVEDKINGILVENNDFESLKRALAFFNKNTFNKEKIIGMTQIKYDALSIVKRYEAVFQTFE